MLKAQAELDNGIYHTTPNLQAINTVKLDWKKPFAVLNNKAGHVDANISVRGQF